MIGLAFVADERVPYPEIDINVVFALTPVVGIGADKAALVVGAVSQSPDRGVTNSSLQLNLSESGLDDIYTHGAHTDLEIEIILKFVDVQFTDADTDIQRQMPGHKQYPVLFQILFLDAE